MVDKERILSLEAAAQAAVINDATVAAEEIMRAAEEKASVILADAKRQAAEVKRLAKIRAAEMALEPAPPRRIRVVLGEGGTNPPGGWWETTVEYTVVMKNREVISATSPQWPSGHCTGVEPQKARAFVYKVGDILPADSKEWERALGLLS